MGTWQAWGWIVALALAVAGIWRLTRTMNHTMVELKERDRALRAADKEVVIQMRMSIAATRKTAAQEFAACASLDEVRALCQKIEAEPNGRHAPGETP